MTWGRQGGRPFSLHLLYLGLKGKGKGTLHKHMQCGQCLGRVSHLGPDPSSAPDMLPSSPCSFPIYKTG